MLAKRHRLVGEVEVDHMGGSMRSCIRYRSWSVQILEDKHVDHIGSTPGTHVPGHTASNKRLAGLGGERGRAG